MAQRSSAVASFKVGSNFMESFLTGNIEVEKTAETEDVTPIGASLSKEAFVGVTTLGEISVEGLYDDTVTTGSDAVFGAIGTTAAVEVGYAGGQSPTKKTAITTIGLKSYKRTIVSKELTKFTATLVNMGTTITET